jgi:hypothetical protein
MCDLVGGVAGSAVLRRPLASRAEVKAGVALRPALAPGLLALTVRSSRVSNCAHSWSCGDGRSADG